MTAARLLRAASVALLLHVVAGPALHAQQPDSGRAASSGGAADGYRAVFALPELDSAFTGGLVLLADRVDGRPLPAGVGPLRLVVPDERRHGRWVRQVIAVRVLRAPER